MVILYFVAYFFAYLMDKSNNLYEVVQGFSASSFDGQYTAFIIRSESVVQSASDGYINFFVGDATPVYVGEQAYLLDKNGVLSESLRAAAMNQAVLNENDLSQIRDSLYNFRTSFRETDYFETYHFKYQIESEILDLVNASVFNKGNIAPGSYEIYNSDLAGIVMHYTDGFENVTTDSFDASAFRKTSYSKNIIKGNDYVGRGTPVYKVITSENWYLVIQINNPDVFRDLDVVSIEFLKDNISTTANFELTARGGNYYGIMSLNKYMIRYASDRYTQISFLEDTYPGLKIPKTAVATNSYYAIPAEYLTQGGNSSEPGFAVRTKNSQGGESVEMRYPYILKETEELCYISTEDVLSYGDVLIKPDSSNEFQVGMTANLQGAYVYNGGSASFRLIEILGENNGFYIVNDKTPGGVRMYDQVYVNYKDVENND